MRKAKPHFRIGDMMSNPRLLGPFFAGDSWNRWKAVLKATFAEPMTADEIAAFKEVAGDRDLPGQPVGEAVFIAGRGGGKDSITSLAVTNIAVNFDPKGKLRPGEQVYVLAVAVDRDQAAILTKYVQAYFEQVPALAALVKSIDRNGVTLKNGVTIVVATNSYRSIRGRSLLACVFDECAFWRSEEIAIPDTEVNAAVAPGLARVPGSMLILISTVHKRSGLLYERYRTYFGKNNDDTLVTIGTTQQFNPTFDAAIIQRQIAEDPQRFGAEYNCQWRDDLASYISRELLEAAVDRGILVRPPAAFRYFAFVDVSGGRHDSCALAIAHRAPDGSSVVLDLVREWPSPSNPIQVVGEMAPLLTSYRCEHVIGDNYAAAWPLECFAQVGISYIKSKRDRSIVYRDALPLFTSGRARLVDNQKMISQFAALERRTFSTGNERIDHGRNGHDDVANAVAGSLTLAAAAGLMAFQQASTATYSGISYVNEPKPSATRLRLEKEMADHVPPCRIDFNNHKNMWHGPGWRAPGFEDRFEGEDQ